MLGLHVFINDLFAVPENRFRILPEELFRQFYMLLVI